MDILKQLSKESALSIDQIATTITLLDEGVESCVNNESPSPCDTTHN